MKSRTLPLRRLFRVVNGGTPTPDDENWGGGVPWATPADMAASFGELRSTRRSLTAKGASRGVSVVPAGSILVSTRAPIGYVALTGSEMAFNQGCRSLVPTADVDCRFFGYQLSAMTNILQANGLGTTFQELSSESLAAALVVVPPVEDQRRIADFLDAETARIDRLLHLTDRQVQLLRELLNQEIREVTSIGKGPVRSTDIPWMPLANAAWPIVKVGYAFLTGSGTTPTTANDRYFDGLYPWVNSADIQDREMTATEKTVTAQALTDYTALRIFPAGSLIIALYGQGTTKGRVGLLKVPACLNQACCALVPMGPVTASFAFYWFRGHKEGVVSLAYGAGQPNLSQELVRQLKIPTPPLELQQGIVRRLRQREVEARRRLHLLRARERLLAERKQALIKAAVTGQFDVPSAGGRGGIEHVNATVADESA